MTDWSGALARAFQRHIEIAGDGGSDGSRHQEPNAEPAVGDETSQRTASLVTVVLGTTATTAVKAEVPGALIDGPHVGQRVVRPGTTGTSCTSHSTSNASLEPQVDSFDERAAIIEYEASVPRNWAEGFARLDQTLRPPEIDAETWRQLIDDGGRFLDRWGSEADRLGWSALDVFGVRSVKPHAGYEAAGLALLIGGGEVVAIDSDRATVRTPSGMILTYLRRTQPDAVVVWDLIDPTTRVAPDRFANEAEHD